MSFLRAGSSSVVERSIAARMVAGSIPVSRLLLLSSLPAWSDVLRCWALNFEKWFHRTTLSHLLRLWLLSNGDCVNSAMRSRCIPSLCWFQWTSTDLDGPSGFRPVSCLSGLYPSLSSHDVPLLSIHFPLHTSDSPGLLCFI